MNLLIVVKENYHYFDRFHIREKVSLAAHTFLNRTNNQIRAVTGQRARLLLTFVKHNAKPDQ